MGYREAIELLANEMRDANLIDEARVEDVKDLLDKEKKSSSVKKKVDKADSEEEKSETKKMLIALKDCELDDWERDFIKSLVSGFKKYKSLTRKQYEKLTDVYEENVAEKSLTTVTEDIAPAKEEEPEVPF